MIDSLDKPHNPMINAGAIVTVSLVKNSLRMADRLDYVSALWAGFSQWFFLKEIAYDLFMWN